VDLKEVQAWIPTTIVVLAIAAMYAVLFGNPKRRFVYNVLIGVPFGAASFFGTLVAAPRITLILSSLSARTGIAIAQLLIGVCVVGAGTGAYWFKNKNLLWYGRVEIVFGSLPALAISAGLNPENVSAAQWASLVGAAYVIGQGLDNMSDHITNVGDGRGNKTLAQSVLTLFWEP
jgi:hypothetical protein